MITILTTTDNPYNPNTDYDLWLSWDEEHGYFTQQYLARVANISASMSEVEARPLIDAAIDEILEVNVLGVYTVV